MPEGVGYKNVQLPSGEVVAFPGDMPDAEINKHVRRHLIGKMGEENARRLAPAPPESEQAPDSEPSALRRLTMGALKQAPLTVIDAAETMNRPAQFAASTLADLVGFGGAAQKARDTQETARYHARAPYEPTEDEGTAGAIGRGVTKAMPQVALAAMTGGASIPVQAGVQGAGQAAQTAAEGGSAGEIATSGTLGAMFGAAGPAVAAGAKSVAPRIINSLIKPLSKAFRFGRDPGRGVVSEGIVARSAPRLAEKLSQKLDDIGGEIDSLLTRKDVASKTIDIMPALQEVDKAVVEAAKTGEKLLVNRLKDLKQALTQELDPVSGEFGLLKDIVMSPKAAHGLKVQLGRASKWTGQAFDGEVNQVRVAVYRALNNLIDKAAPGAKKLQARYADMLTASSSLERTMTIKARQNMLSFPNIVLGTAGAATGGLPGAIAAAGVRTVAGTTAAKTTAAYGLSRMPNLAPALQAGVRSQSLNDLIQQK